MVPQSIYWKHCLCQHLPAFLGAGGRSGWAVVPLSTSFWPCSSAKASLWKGCKERCLHSARAGGKRTELSSPEALSGENCPEWSHQLFCLDFIFGVRRHASGEKSNSSNSHLKLSKILNRFLNTDTTLGEWQFRLTRLSCETWNSPTDLENKRKMTVCSLGKRGNLPILKNTINERLYQEFERKIFTKKTLKYISMLQRNCNNLHECSVNIFWTPTS